MLAIQPHSASAGPRRIKVIAAGNAGINILDRISLADGGSLDCAAVNTDAQSLAACVASEKILLGEMATRGMGAGGDPALAVSALEEDGDALAGLLEDADAFLLVGCFGGGTAGVVLAHLAGLIASKGLPVFSVLTLPFSFEGARRAEQARDALEQLRPACPVAAVFPNDGLAELAAPSGPVTEAFALSDELLAGVIRSLLGVLRGQGPMDLRAEQLMALLRGTEKGSLFTHAQATGANRANDVVAKALKSPLLRAGLAPEEVNRVAIHLAADKSLSLVETQTVLSLLQRHLDDSVTMQLGISTDGHPEVGLALTIFGARGEPLAVPTEATPVVAPQAQPVTPIPSPEKAKTAPDQKVQREPEVEAEPEIDPKVGPNDLDLQDEESPLPAEQEKEESLPPEPAPVIPIPEKIPVPKSPGPATGDLLPGMQQQVGLKSNSVAKETKKSAPKHKQEVLPLDVAARGRFERSEPTIVEGEDLDVPTFLRLRLKIKP